MPLATCDQQRHFLQENTALHNPNKRAEFLELAT